MADTYYRVTVVYWSDSLVETYPTYDQAVVMADRRSKGAVKLWIDEVRRCFVNGRVREHVRARRLHIDASLADSEYEWARLRMLAEHRR